MFPGRVRHCHVSLHHPRHSAHLERTIGGSMARHTVLHRSEVGTSCQRKGQHRVIITRRTVTSSTGRGTA